MLDAENQNIEEILTQQIRAHNIKKICVSLSGGVDSIVLPDSVSPNSPVHHGITGFLSHQRIK